jgi:hypothetical protein
MSTKSGSWEVRKLGQHSDRRFAGGHTKLLNFSASQLLSFVARFGFFFTSWTDKGKNLKNGRESRGLQHFHRCTNADWAV